ncbi:MAG: hypothetical protein LWX07_02005 [Bacteroidetes bacterium]|nr:hypothetical protein [Bacteroidota bacterium]
MQSYCFEIKSVCKSCGGPLSINAFANDIYCEACGSKNTLSFENWKSIVAENIKEAKGFAEGEGQNSKTFAGDFEFSLLFGKQKARCGKCKTAIPDDFYSSFTGGNYHCANCGNDVNIRKPDDFVLKIVPNAVFLAGEDANQMNAGKETMKKPDDVKPVLFSCPSCAGNLEVDGTSRMITCKFCNSKIYLPDELWHELHPVKTVSRWYVLIDESKVSENNIPEWYHLSDVASDSEGNIYIAGADDEEEQFILFSISPQMKVRWQRQDIKYEHEGAGITTTKDGKLLLWNKNKKSLNVYSCMDGKDLPGIKGADVSANDRYPFNLKGCTSLISDSDGTLLAVVNNAFVRFYDDGSRAPVWTMVSQKGEKPGLFSRLFGGGDTEVEIPQSEASASYLKDTGNTPKTIVGEFTTMSIGYDGYLYMLDKSSGDGVLAKYTREGKQLWKALVPIGWKECKPCADRNGNVFVIGKNDDNNTVNLLKFSEDGKKVELVANDVVEGGILSDEELIAMSPDGTIFALRYYEVLKIIAPDMSLKYISKQAKEEDKDKIDDFKKKKSNEE